MAGFKISDFSAQTKQLVRANRFLLKFPGIPSGLTAPTNLIYLSKDVSIPDLSANKIPLEWFGREVYIPGDPNFANFDVTMRVPEDWGVVDFLYTWQQLSANKDDNVRANSEDHKGILQLEQYSGLEGDDGSPIATYYIHGAFPLTVTGVELSQDSTDTLIEVSASFSVELWSNDADITTGSTTTAI